MQDKSAIINAAQKLASKGQIDKAIAEWEKLIVNSKDGNVYNTIGDLYLKKGSETEAIVSFTKAAEIFKKDGFYPKAIALYKKILNIVPNDVNSMISLGKLNDDKGLTGSAIDYYFKAAEIYHREGSTENATTVVERILQLEPTDAETRKKIAYLYFRLGLRKRAANEYASIADDLLKKNDLEQAEEMCNQAIEFDPENTQAFASMSKLAELNNDQEKAFQYMEKAVSLEPDNKVLLMSFSSLLLNSNRTDEAIPALIKQIENHPTDLEAKRMLGEVYLKAGLYEQAWAELLPCIESSLASKEWAKAHELLDGFRESYPIPVKQHLLTICKAQGDDEKTKTELRELAALYEGEHAGENALNVYRELLELSPDDSSAAQKIQELEISLGIAEPITEEPVVSDSPPASEALPPQESVTEVPVPEQENSTDLQQEPASPVQDKPASPEAEPAPQPDLIHYEEVLSAPAEPGPEKINDVSAIPEVKPAGNLAERKAEADFYAKQGLNNEALEIYRELLSFDPDNEEINNKINSLSQSSSVTVQPDEQEKMEVTELQKEAAVAQPSVDDDLQDIFTAFGKSEEAQVEDYEARYQAGLELRQQGRLDDAIKELRIAVQDPAKMVRNSTMLAMCYMEMRSYPLAIVGFNKVLDSMSSSDSTYIHVKYELAKAYLNNKENQKALELFSEIHAQNPDFKDVSATLNTLKPPPQDNKPKPKRDRVSYI
jgi:tetratricopeptide (TPR) repeat protein